MSRRMRPTSVPTSSHDSSTDLRLGNRPFLHTDGAAMTRKDYILIAATLRADAAHLSPERETSFDYTTAAKWEQGAYDQWNTTVLAFADTLSRDNPRFDRERFLK